MSNNARPFANPAPAGLMVLTFYLSCLFPVMTGRAPAEMIYVLIPLGFAGGIVQLAVGIMELRLGVIVGGNVMCGFSAFMFLGMGENLLKVLGLIPHHTASVDGFIFTVMGLYMVGFTLPYLQKNLVASLFILLTDIFFMGLGVSFLFNIPMLSTIASWTIIPVIITAMWQAIAEVVNTSTGTTLIKLGPALLKNRQSLYQNAPINRENMQAILNK